MLGLSINRYGTGDLSRATTPRCLECHSTYFEHRPGTTNEYNRHNFILGVTCERCHGPGQEHVAYHQAHPQAKAGKAVVNPSHLSRERLIAQLERIVDAGNSVVVVEHDMDVVSHSDWIIDLGPGAGHDGGRIVFEGPPATLVADRPTLTGEHLAAYVGA